MTRTLVIAEVGSSHDNKLESAYRLIEAAKECGADAVKFQYWSNSKALAARRGMPELESKYEAYRMYQSNLQNLKNKADAVGIEFMCTVYLIEDIATIAPLVKRFKVSAYESDWREFMDAHYQFDKEVIASNKHGRAMRAEGLSKWRMLYCVSEYPTPLEHLKLSNLATYHYGIKNEPIISYHGISDHTANVLTGAAAVALGSKVVESHIRLEETMPDNPDYEHSLTADGMNGVNYEYGQYVRNIRTIERML